MAIKRSMLFVYDDLRGSLDSPGAVYRKNFDELSRTNFDSTSSFTYAQLGDALKSTQQLNIDWANFENHTFFGSAVVNTNVAFDNIINTFPFDGTKRDLEVFFEGLTGYERYVYDLFPKNKGYLFFSGSAVNEPNHSGTYVQLTDYAGTEYTTLARNKTGETILDPGANPYTIECYFYAPDITNDNQVLCQKLSGSDGITLYLSQSASTSTADVAFLITSGSQYLEVSAPIDKAEFTHLAAVYDTADNRAKIYCDGTLQAETAEQANLRNIRFASSDLMIGSGSAHTFVDGVVTPQQTLSGALDEFRFWHEARTQQKIRLFAKKNVPASDELKLYFKFNEPTGSIDVNTILLDSSGNSLHGTITNFAFDLRSTGSIAVPMEHEKLSMNPVLFSAHDDVSALNIDLLLSASNYDDNNPNIITRLIPRHYLIEGRVEEAYDDEAGTIVNVISGSGMPGELNVGSAQLMGALLYTWAKFFDELKMMVDAYGNLRHIDYDEYDNVPNNFLQMMANAEGFELPALFADASIEQYVDAENLLGDVSTGTVSLRNVQNQIWRQILINLRDITQSKGTINSIKSFVRAAGINPDTTFRIREFGSTVRESLRDARDQRVEVAAMLDMSGSTATVTSAPLSGTEGRIEPGWPEAQGVAADDKLFTSGSFTVEAIYKLPSTTVPVTQSLMRMVSQGADDGCQANLVAIRDGDNSRVKLFVKSTTVTGSEAPHLELPLTGVNIFDDEQWHIAFGRYRQDDENIVSDVSSSYFVSARRQNYGDIVAEHYTSSYYMEDPENDVDRDVFQNIIALRNTEGSQLQFGTGSIPLQDYFLNNTGSVDIDEARAAEFTGKIGQVRFWSKALSVVELQEHTRNFKSLGVETPQTNFNFNTSRSGSFEKLRLDYSMDQAVTESNGSGAITIVDFSQNELWGTGTSFENSTDIIKPETFYYSMLTPHYDSVGSNNKIRPRSFIDPDKVGPGQAVAPLYALPPRDQPRDDARLSIDFSVVDALNEDIIKLFATFDEIESALGRPEMLYSPDYPRLAALRQVYFQRLTDVINLKGFFEFFKWFDQSMGTFIQQLVPRKTDFRGINYVIEPHALERAKLQHRNAEQYIGPDRRYSQFGNIYLQQFLAILKRM